VFGNRRQGVSCFPRTPLDTSISAAGLNVRSGHLALPCRHQLHSLAAYPISPGQAEQTKLL
jgi:hypothetical protein